MNRQENILEFPIIATPGSLSSIPTAKLMEPTKQKEMRTHPDFELVRKTNGYLPDRKSGLVSRSASMVFLRGLRRGGNHPSD